MKIAVAGAGAFGTALGISLSRVGRHVTLIARDPSAASLMQRERFNPKLTDCPFPQSLNVSAGLEHIEDADVILLAMPAQSLRGFLSETAQKLSGKYLIACCKGIDLTSLTGPTSIIADVVPNARPAMLTGPSFAFDIARGLPTALTLAMENQLDCELLQNELTTDNLRIYRTADVIGAELGGALKNVIAIGAGVAIGGNLGDSARSAMMTRGFGEMRLLASALGAKPETLNGLSGFGDLALTCTSELSRNYCHGLAIGRGDVPDPTKTVEGVSTAKAVVELARKHDLDLPVCTVVAAICDGKLTIEEALASLLSRPLREE